MPTWIGSRLLTRPHEIGAAEGPSPMLSHCSRLAKPRCKTIVLCRAGQYCCCEATSVLQRPTVNAHGNAYRGDVLSKQHLTALNPPVRKPQLHAAVSRSKERHDMSPLMQRAPLSESHQVKYVGSTIRCAQCPRIRPTQPQPSLCCATTLDFSEPLTAHVSCSTHSLPTAQLILFPGGGSQLLAGKTRDETTRYCVGLLTSGR